jgi:hypothetical protein
MQKITGEGHLPMWDAPCLFRQDDGVVLIQIEIVFVGFALSTKNLVISIPYLILDL